MFHLRLTIAEEGCARILNHRSSTHTLVKLCKALGADETGTDQYFGKESTCYFIYTIRVKFYLVIMVLFHRKRNECCICHRETV